MADICPVCGEPHGKGMPNSKWNPAARPETPLPEGVAEIITDDPAMNLVIDTPDPPPVDPAFATDPLADFIDAPEEDAPVEAPPEEAAPEETPVAAEPKDRVQMRFRELRAEAAERNLTVPFGATKATLIGLLSGDDPK